MQKFVEEDDDDEEEEIRYRLSPRTTRTTMTKPRHPVISMTFIDVEDSIPKYDGTTSIEACLDTFEELAAFTQLGDLEKFIIANKCLTDEAKLIRGEIGLTTWTKLPPALRMI